MTGRRAAELWVGGFVILAGALVLLYPDSHQRDGGYHFLFARWAWVHPELFVGVWSRPAFTLLYSLPAQFGYPTAKLFTVLLCAACAWQTWKLAVQLGSARSPLVIPLLVFQPSFLLLSSETMTEPLFALILVSALRLQYGGRPVASMLVASTLILARPEGAIVIAVWAGWVLMERRNIRWIFCLGGGVAAWWLLAWGVTGDPLYIRNSWPRDWSATGAAYGTGTGLQFLARFLEEIGPFYIVPFVLGVGVSIRNRRGRALVAVTTAVLLTHAALWWAGSFGSAGYPRYLVTMAPAIALLSLMGWNAMADRIPISRYDARVAGAAGTLALSALAAVLYVDGWSTSRDAWAINDAFTVYRRDPKEVRMVVWSHPYMAIRLDADPWDLPEWGTRDENLRRIERLESGTLVFWDSIFGPNLTYLSDVDFKRAGFQVLHAHAYELTRNFGPRAGWVGLDGPRRQEMHLLYKP